MKKMREEFRIELPGIDRPAKVIVRRIGQQLPSLGDGVVAEAAILLPAEDGLLIEPLRFEGRLAIAKEELSVWWGREGKADKVRQKEREFAAPTWAEAFRSAREWAEGELARLVDALIRRRKALEMAEDEA